MEYGVIFVITSTVLDRRNPSCGFLSHSCRNVFGLTRCANTGSLKWSGENGIIFLIIDLYCTLSPLIWMKPSMGNLNRLLSIGYPTDEYSSLCWLRCFLASLTSTLFGSALNRMASIIAPRYRRPPLSHHARSLARGVSKSHEERHTTPISPLPHPQAARGGFATAPAPPSPARGRRG